MTKQKLIEELKKEVYSLEQTQIIGKALFGDGGRSRNIRDIKKCIRALESQQSVSGGALGHSLESGMF